MVKLKVSEMFASIQGEGRYTGYPALFVRLSGCTRECSFCDTKYHTGGDAVEVATVLFTITEFKNKIIVFTGGEPLVQWDVLRKMSKGRSFGGDWHLETNGDLIKESMLHDLMSLFTYIVVSPKDVKVAERIAELKKKDWVFGSGTEIKVVTDLDGVGRDMLQYADSVMPLTTGDEKKDLEIKRAVWVYCVNYNKRYSPRLHVDVWGQERGK